MFNNKNALKGFAAGTLAAAIVMILSVWPAVGYYENKLSFSQDLQAPSEMADPDISLRGDEPGAIKVDSTIPNQAFDGVSPLVIPAAAFADDGDFTDYSFSFGGGYVAGGFACMQAPAYLPDGAVIDEIFASIYDNSTSGFVDPFLWRVDNFTGASNILASVSTTTAGASTAIQVLNDNTISNPLVSYPGYSYYVTVCLDDLDTRLYSVRIYFSQAVYLPVIFKN